MESGGLYSHQDTWQLPLDFISHNTVHSTHLSICPAAAREVINPQALWVSEHHWPERERESETECALSGILKEQSVYL